MDDREWLTSTDPQGILGFLRAWGRASDRKLRLFVAACARSLLPVFGDKLEAVAVVHERHADGQASDEDLIRYFSGGMFDRLYPDGVIPPTHKLQPVWESARVAAKTATDFTHLDSRDNTGAEKARICNLLRDILGPLPFRPLPPLERPVRAWNDGFIVKLATAIYEERSLPEGTLDSLRLGVLADALEEAGVTDQDILGHLRQQGAVHVRGCFVLDLLLGKS